MQCGEAGGCPSGTSRNHARLRYRKTPYPGPISFVGSHLLSLTYLVLFGRYISDSLSGVRAVRAADASAAGTTLTGTDANHHLLSRLLRRKADLVEIPVQFFPMSPALVRRPAARRPARDRHHHRASPVVEIMTRRVLIIPAAGLGTPALAAAEAARARRGDRDDRSSATALRAPESAERSSSPTRRRGRWSSSSSSATMST